MISTAGSQLGGLTFAGPDGHDDLVLHAEDDGRDDDSGQGRLGDKGAVVHQVSEAEQHQGPGVDPAHGSLDAAKNICWLVKKYYVVLHLELLTAVLEKEPVVGMEDTKEPIRLQTPRATIS